jgi:hypothetical protein
MMNAVRGIVFSESGTIRCLTDLASFYSLRSSLVLLWGRIAILLQVRRARIRIVRVLFSSLTSISSIGMGAGGGFTQVHQDGHGTVDSGHSCLLGYNEVVILRRLPDCHKHNACRMVPSLKECTADEKAHNMLFRLPHDDGRKDAPAWPSDDTIEYWTNMG